MWWSLQTMFWSFWRPKTLHLSSCGSYVLFFLLKLQGTKKKAQLMIFLEADSGFLICSLAGICHWEPHKEFKTTSPQGYFILSNLPELEQLGCSCWLQPCFFLHSSCIIPEVELKHLCDSILNIDQMRNPTNQLALQNQ